MDFDSGHKEEIPRNRGKSKNNAKKKKREEKTRENRGIWKMFFGLQEREKRERTKRTKAIVGEEWSVSRTRAE